MTANLFSTGNFHDAHVVAWMQHHGLLPLSDAAAAALKPCFATRGKHKGMLKAKAPSPFQFPAEYAAYQGAMLACNPFKASIVGMMLMKPEHKAICDEVCAYIEARPHLVRVLQSDRNILEKLGAW